MGILERLEPQAATVAKSQKNGRTNKQTDEQKKGRTNRRTKEETNEQRHYELHGTIQSRNSVSGNVLLQNEQPKASLNSVQDEQIDGRTNELTDGRTDGLNKGRTGARSNEGTTEVLLGMKSDRMTDRQIQLLTKFGQTDRLTDRRTDRQSDSYIAPITNESGITVMSSSMNETHWKTMRISGISTDKHERTTLENHENIGNQYRVVRMKEPLWKTMRISEIIVNMEEPGNILSIVSRKSSRESVMSILSIVSRESILIILSRKSPESVLSIVSRESVLISDHEINTMESHENIGKQY
ncbi:hypothetical protein DPMN_003378 [Dreissena polymorpha]|uniref:Uncharacterized protein n=1 Tax=Dreissena polymorpha TaxID=45954 RepID=A0A9D4MNS0_DREPO|nr:hypothetical protein DPMN_003378 [Dreissena polymorpha]